MIRVAALVVVLAASVSAQDAAPGLAAKAPAVGDRATVKLELVAEFDITTKDTQTQTRQLSLVRTEEFSQVVIEAAEGALRQRIACSASKLQVSGTNISPRTEATDLQGRALVVTQTEKGKVVKLENGDPAPLEAAGVGAWDAALGLLPKGEPKEGAVWTVDAAGLAELVSVADRLSGTGAFEVKLEKLAEGKATITFTGLVEAKTSRGTTVKVNVTAGKFEFDAAKGRPVSLSIAADVEAAQDIFQRIPKPGELRPEEKVGDVTLKSRKFEVKVAWE